MAIRRRRDVEGEKRVRTAVYPPVLPEGFPTRRDAETGKALLCLASRLHGGLLPSFCEEGHRERLRAHRRRVLAGTRRARARRIREFRRWREAEAKAQAVLSS